MVDIIIKEDLSTVEVWITRKTETMKIEEVVIREADAIFPLLIKKFSSSLGF